MLSKIKKFFTKPKIQPLKIPLNRGVILGQRNTDYVAGTLPFIENNPSGDWTSYLPPGEWQRVESFDTMACFPYDTKILMENFKIKRISEIKVGEYVISHLGRKQKVIKTMKRNYDRLLYKIKIKGIYNEIECTDEHPILTEKGWKKAKELMTNDRVLLPLTNELIKDLTIGEIEKNKDFLWLLGLYLAEGSLGKETIIQNNNPKLKVNGTGNGRGNILFSLSQQENKFADKIIRIGKELFNTKFHIHNKKNNKGMSVYGYNVYLRDLLLELGGEYCDKKEINTRLMFLEPLQQMEILKGWLDGDGHFNKNKRYIIGVSISEKLIQQMFRICLRNSIKANLIKRLAYQNHKEAFEIRIYGIETNKILNWELQDLRLNLAGYKTRRKKKFINNCLSQKISKISKIKWNKHNKVYNLEIENDNSYIVNNVAVHNCVTFSALNILETLYFFQTKQHRNFSDRFTAYMSGTTPNGNYLWKVADSIRKDGLIDEELWPAPNAQPSWSEYYKTPPIESINKAKEFLNDWQINYEFIDFTKESLMHHLKQSPIQVVIPGHAIMNFFTNNEVYKYFDSYAPFIKERTEPFVSALKYVLSRKNNMEKLRLIGDKSTGKQYILGINNRLRWIFNPTILNAAHDMGIIDKNQVNWQPDISGYEIDDPLAVIKNN